MKYFSYLFMTCSALLVGCNGEIKEVQKESQTPKGAITQKIILSVDSVSCEGEYCGMVMGVLQADCSAKHKDIDRFTGAGWRIVASSSKTVRAGSNGSCVGTEYVIEKFIPS